MNLYITMSSVYEKDPRYNKLPRYSEQILPVPWPFFNRASTVLKCQIYARRFLIHQVLYTWVFTPGGGGAGVVLSYNRLMGMCPWMGSHFHEYGVAFSRELYQNGSHIFGFFRVRHFFIFPISKLTRIFALQMKSIVPSIQSQKMDQFIKIESD